MPSSVRGLRWGCWEGREGRCEKWHGDGPDGDMPGCAHVMARLFYIFPLTAEGCAVQRTRAGAEPNCDLCSWWFLGSRLQNAAVANAGENFQLVSRRRILKQKAPDSTFQSAGVLQWFRGIWNTLRVFEAIYENKVGANYKTNCRSFRLIGQTNLLNLINLW
jgi:hypothetical protein